MEQGQKSILKSKVFWFSIAGGLLLLVLFFVFVSGDSTASEEGSTTPPSTTPPTTTLPSQTYKSYKCETRKTCQGRVGFSNWIKTGDKDNCNKGAWRCYNDCKGTCETWE